MRINIRPQSSYLKAYRNKTIAMCTMSHMSLLNKDLFFECQSGITLNNIHKSVLSCSSSVSAIHHSALPACCCHHYQKHPLIISEKNVKPISGKPNSLIYTVHTVVFTVQCFDLEILY